MTLTGHSTSTSDSSTRLPGLDALRAGALGLGIVLHSLLPFVPGLPWLVSDDRSAMVLGIPVYVIHLFRMVLFMLLAGFFGRMVLQRRGARNYLRDRLLRILLPFVVFWPVAVLPLGALAVVNARLRGLPFTPPPSSAAHPLLAVNPGQLWFLLVLMRCVVIMLVVRAAAGLLISPAAGERVETAVGRLVSSRAGVVVAALPYGVCLMLQGTVVGGIRAPATLLPSWPPLVAYLGAFTVGWALHACPAALARIARSWPVHLAAAAAFTLMGLPQSTPASTTPLPVAAAVTALAGWCWAYALLGMAVRFLTVERPAVRYLADGSYWLYLMHLPLLVGIEIALAPLAWPIALKSIVTWLTAGLMLVTSYHLLVRSTPIGRWLNGRRHPFRLLPRTRAASGPASESVAATRSGRDQRS